MKVTKETTLVDGFCPGCWKEEGRDHADDCMVPRNFKTRKEAQKEEEQSEWLQKALAIQREARAKRRPRPLSPTQTTPLKPTARSGKIGRLEDVIQNVYATLREKFKGIKVQAIVEFPQEAEGEHVWDIRAKYVPIDGELWCRLQQSRTNKVLGYAVFTLKDRVVVEVEFER